MRCFSQFSLLSFSSILLCSSFGLFVLNGCNETNMNLTRERHRVSLFFVSSLLPIHCFVASVLKVPLTLLPLLLTTYLLCHYPLFLILLNSKFKNQGIYFHKMVVHLSLWPSWLLFVSCAVIFHFPFSFILVKVSQVVEPRITYKCIS